MPARAVISHAQTNTASGFTMANNIAVAQGSNPTAGNFITVVVGTVGLAAVTTVTDTLGNTYSLRRGHTDSVWTGYRVEIWRAFNIAGGGANTVTANLADDNDKRTICVSEWSGALATNPDDQVDSAHETGGPGNTVPDPGTITPVEDNELIVAAAATDAGAFTPAGSFVQRQDVSDGAGYRVGVATLIQGAAASITTFWTASSGNWGAAAASFKAAGGGGGGLAVDDGGVMVTPVHSW